MSEPQAPRCCSICDGLFPLPIHLGLHSSVYCAEPEHWRGVGLSPDAIVTGIEAYNARKAALQADRVKLRELMDSVRAKMKNADQVEQEWRAARERLEQERLAVEQWLEQERLAVEQQQNALPGPQDEADIRRMLSWLDEAPPEG